MFGHSISGKSRIFLSLSLLTLAATTVALAAKGGWSDEGVPIKGNFTVSIAFIANSSACGMGDDCIACVNHDPPRFYIQAEGMVGLGGLEPPTSPLSGARSSHLSYRPKSSSGFQKY